MSDPNDPYSGGAVPPPPPGGGFTPPPPPPPGGGAITPPGPVDGGYTPPPPPGGGYTPPPPAPPGGGYAPPPPAPPGPPGGGYMPPPPAAPGGYQAYQPGGMPGNAPGGRADIGTAFSWSSAKFQQHLVPFLTLSGIIAAVTLIGGIIGSALANSAADGLTITEDGRLVDQSNFWGGFIGGMVILVLTALITAFLRIGLLRAALRTTRGETPAIADLTTGANVGKYIATALCAAILTGIGFIFCFVPGLIVAFFLLFAPTHALDKGASVGDAFSWSFNAVKANVVPCIVLVLIGIVVAIITGIAGGIAGTIVGTILGLFIEPISALLNANLYRQMGSEPIAP